MVWSSVRSWEPSHLQVQFISLTAGTVGTALSHPLEFLKTRIQIANEGIGIRQKGPAFGYNASRLFWHLHEAGYGTQSLYTGFKAALVGRLAYLAIRNGFYKLIYDTNKPAKTRNDLTWRQKGTIGAVSSMIATLAVHPLETIMVRQIGDLGRAARFQRPDPFHNLYAGLGANLIRVGLINGSTIWAYEAMKERLYHTFGDIWPNKQFALAVASLLGLGLTLVPDVVRTRQMFALADPSLNRLRYKSGLDVVVQAVKHEGFATFLAGAWPWYARIYVNFATVS